MVKETFVQYTRRHFEAPCFSKRAGWEGSVFLRNLGKEEGLKEPLFSQPSFEAVKEKKNHSSLVFLRFTSRDTFDPLK